MIMMMMMEENLDGKVPFVSTKTSLIVLRGCVLYDSSIQVVKQTNAISAAMN